MASINASWWLSLSSTGTNWNSTLSSFSTEKTVQESIIIPENIGVNPGQTEYSLSEKRLEEILKYVTDRLNSKDKVDYEEIAENLLKTESFLNVIDKSKVHEEFSNKQTNIEDIIESQRKSIEALTNEVRQLKTDFTNLQNNQANTDEKNVKIYTESTQKMDYFLYKLNRCCRKVVDLEAHMLKSFTAALNDPNFLQNQEGLQNWLYTLFVAKTELENSLSQLTESLNSNLDSLLESNSKFLMDHVTAKLKSEFNVKYTESEVIQGSPVNISAHIVKKIIKDTLSIYDADKTGLVDYAMEPMGGQVITTRCTESYHAGTAVVSVFGLPLWYPVASPRTVITPGISPGKCWAFQNFPGLLVIKLMIPITIEAFSYEHVSKLLVPDGKIDSAPKDFEVYGLEHENDRNGIKLGNYRYDFNGESLQFFTSQSTNSTLQYVELRVVSNHGNPNYTCLYRFRVHGKKAAS